VSPQYYEIDGVTMEEGHAKVFSNNGYLSMWKADGTFELFQLLQFHFHSPSEHTINGKHYDAEMHIVHQDASNNNQLAVLGVFFDRQAGGNKENPLLAELDLGEDGTTLNHITLMSVIDKLNLEKEYSYSGSLTTPPCSEPVIWAVIDDPQPISDEQLAGFTRRWSNADGWNGHGNNRNT
jgi:carbonic anhydrase